MVVAWASRSSAAFGSFRVVSMNLDPMIIFLLAILGAIGVILLLMIRDTIRRRGRWGLNFDQVKCPRCGEETPKIRKPNSLRQAAWGGSCCSHCGCEFDKWGVEIGL